jgi:hypothetical protein
VRMPVRFQIVVWMRMVVGTVVTLVCMLMHTGIVFVCMSMLVLVQVIVCVGVRVLVRVACVSVFVLMGMLVRMLMAVYMFVLMRSFHGGLPPLSGFEVCLNNGKLSIGNCQMISRGRLK